MSAGGPEKNSYATVFIVTHDTHLVVLVRAPPKNTPYRLLNTPPLLVRS